LGADVRKVRKERTTGEKPENARGALPGSPWSDITTIKQNGGPKMKNSPDGGGGRMEGGLRQRSAKFKRGGQDLGGESDEKKRGGIINGGGWEKA